MSKNIKVCFAASSGGHLEEISRLNEIAEKYDHFLITEKSFGFNFVINTPTYFNIVFLQGILYTCKLHFSTKNDATKKFLCIHLKIGIHRNKFIENYNTLYV